MPFKMVSNLEKDCGRISGFAGSQAAMIAHSLTERWRHKLPPDQEVINVLQVQTFLSEELDDVHQVLISTENEHVAELAEDREAREARDAATAELREKLFQARHIFEGIFGPSASDKIFQEPALVPVDPVPLYRLAQRIHANLLNPDFPLPPVRLDIGARLEAIARGFEDPMQRLGTALRRLNWGLPDSSASLAVKQGVMAQLGDEVGDTTRYLKALYVIAGHPGLADRVQRSRHRPRGDASGDDAPVDVDPTGGDEGGDSPDVDTEPDSAPAAEAEEESSEAPDLPEELAAPAEEGPSS